MAGIYLHIPFCKTRCIYCDFYSTTRSEWTDRYVEALCTELTRRKDYLQGEPVHTIYMGGGTPSQLSEEHFRKLFHTLQQVYGLEQCHEITLEANPDDLTEEYTAMLKTLPFNRISMGIQTFHEDTLRLLHRRHTGAQAIRAVELCRKAGFQNISIDLIYGLPGENDFRWNQDLQQAIQLQVEHISAYHLTYEEGTPLYDMLHQHSVQEVDEESSLRFFTSLMDTLKDAGYEHYEISNFCKPGFHSRHNTAYWQGIAYLGCGPSAHSFNGSSRQWNKASLSAYMNGIEQDTCIYETEQLDVYTRYNECVMTGLRTQKGISLKQLHDTFGMQLKDYCLRNADTYLKNGQLEIHNEYLRLTRAGIFISDGIMSDLMYIED